MAKRAGVGVGTLYRHFPTRDDLIEAAYRNEVELLTASVDELLASHPPDIALEEWAKRFVAYAQTKRGMSGALQAVIASGRDPYAATRGKLTDALATLLAAGVEKGVLRADASAEDVVLSLGGIFQLPESDDWAERAERMLGIVVDGLRYGAGR